MKFVLFEEFSLRVRRDDISKQRFPASGQKPRYTIHSVDMSLHPFFSIYEKLTLYGAFVNLQLHYNNSILNILITVILTYPIDVYKN